LPLRRTHPPELSVFTGVEVPDVSRGMAEKNTPCLPGYSEAQRLFLTRQMVAAKWLCQYWQQRHDR